jgi:hypothetical protein
VIHRILSLGLIASACCVITPASAAVKVAARIWDGSIQILTQTAACDGAGFSIVGNIPGYFRPHLKAADPKAAIMAGDGDKQVMLEDDGNNPDLSGFGYYNGTFLNAKSNIVKWSGTGTYDFTLVDPFSATSTYVKLTGSITDFAGIPGCNLTLRAGFIQRLPSNN